MDEAQLNELEQRVKSWPDPILIATYTIQRVPKSPETLNFISQELKRRNISGVGGWLLFFVILMFLNSCAFLVLAALLPFVGELVLAVVLGVFGVYGLFSL